MPAHIDEATILSAISPDKDVDGLHPLNVALLAKGKDTRSGLAFSLNTINYHIACTPQGCIELLERYGVDIQGKNAVVLGRLN